MAIVAICGTKSLTMPPNHDNNNLFPPLLIEKYVSSLQIDDTKTW